MTRFLFGFAVLSVVVPFTAPDTRASYIYWSDYGTTDFNSPPPVGDIRRANLDGSGQITLISGLLLPGGPALDVARGQMYFGAADAMRRANLDGTGSTIIVSSGTGSPALDLAHGQMYWNLGGFGGPTDGKIIRANLDGSGMGPIITGLNQPHHIALDLVDRKMYWADVGSGDISRANLDGSGREFVLTNLPSPNNVALDIAGGKMYWDDDSTNDIYRANLDGSAQQVLVRNLAGPVGLALDLAAGKMYWTDFGSGSSEVADGDIRRANLDGTGQTVLISGLPEAIGISLDVPEPGSAMLLAGCILPLAWRRRVQRLR